MFSAEMVLPVDQQLPRLLLMAARLSLTIISYADCTWFVSLLIRFQASLGDLVSMPSGLVIYSQLSDTGCKGVALAQTEKIKRIVQLNIFIPEFLSG